MHLGTGHRGRGPAFDNVFRHINTGCLSNVSNDKENAQINNSDEKTGLNGDVDVDRVLIVSLTN